METLYAFMQSQEEIYKKLIILLTIFIIFAFGVYISYILNATSAKLFKLSISLTVTPSIVVVSLT